MCLEQNDTHTLMFYNVVDAYAMHTKTILTQLLDYSFNACQCLRRTNKILFFPIKMPLVTSVHTEVTKNCLMIFIVRYTVCITHALRLSFRKYFYLNTFGNIYE